MKKLIVLLAMLSMLIPIRVTATCKDTDLQTLRNEASLVEMVYRQNHENNFSIVISDLNERLFVKDTSSTNTYFFNGNKEIEITGINGGNVKTFQIVSTSSSNCPINVLRTVNVIVPRYNKHYEKDVCRGIEESFSYCAKWYPNEISEDKFNSEYKLYMESKDRPAVKEVDEKKEFSIFDFLIVNYLYFLVPIIVMSLAAIIFVKIRENRYFK